MECLSLCCHGDTCMAFLSLVTVCQMLPVAVATTGGRGTGEHTMTEGGRLPGMAAIHCSTHHAVELCHSRPSHWPHPTPRPSPHPPLAPSLPHSLPSPSSTHTLTSPTITTHPIPVSLSCSFLLPLQLFYSVASMCSTPRGWSCWHEDCGVGEDAARAHMCSCTGSSVRAIEWQLLKQYYIIVQVP